MPGLFLVINLFLIFISSPASFGNLYLSRNLSILSKLSNLLAHVVYSIFLKLFFVSVRLVAMSPLSFQSSSLSLFSFIFVQPK